MWISSELVEARGDLVLGKLTSQPPSLTGPISTAQQVSYELFDGLTAAHSKPYETFSLLLAVGLATRFMRHDHLAL
ncbi:MAG: hypothetical protein JO296_01630 [Pseudonocardiales bacterium]|nr:hypothetical protein [Pseudonocardiales bacterium]